MFLFVRGFSALRESDTSVATLRMSQTDTLPFRHHLHPLEIHHAQKPIQAKKTVVALVITVVGSVIGTLIYVGACTPRVYRVQIVPIGGADFAEDRCSDAAKEA